MKIKPYPVIVCGTRTFDNYNLLVHVLDKLLSNKKRVEIVSGWCRGADRLGEKYALSKGYLVKRFPVTHEDKVVNGNYAFLLRNTTMASYAYRGSCVAFWDGESTGTYDMICKAFDPQMEIENIVICFYNQKKLVSAKDFFENWQKYDFLSLKVKKRLAQR